MGPRRGESGLSGVLAIDKPASMTSHDVVDIVRRATGEKRVGHAGTLDPMATGLLMIMVGPATRLAPYLTAAQKGYAASIVFGTETDTHDAEGQVTLQEPVPPELADPVFAAQTLAAQVREIEQVPPAFSAVKVEGRKAYEMARSGREVSLKPRTVRIVQAALEDTKAGPPVVWDVRLLVSKGFYVRSFARDLGRELGTVANLGALRRTSSGATSIDSALSLEALHTASDASALFSDPVQALALPAHEVVADDAARIRDGRRLPASSELAGVLDASGSADSARESDKCIALTHCGMLLAIYQLDGDELKPVTVLAGGVMGVGTT